MKNSCLSVAIVHDWLIHMRGGEKVLDALAEVFPNATIYTLFSHRKRLSPALQKMKIRNSILQYFPGIRIYYRWLLPLLPFFIRTLRVERVDLVISSSHCVAKGIRIPRGAKHVSYCHTPMRYLWGFEEEYFDKFPKGFLFLLRPVFDFLRKWDVETSKKVDHFLCNSETVRNRIRKIYGREATVVHPPVDTQFFRPNSKPEKGDYYLVVSALTPYKRIDLAIEAFNGLERKLLIAGDGPLRKQYGRGVKKTTIRFLGKVSDDRLLHLYTGAKALIFPQEEDFGIVPLEAQACGTPVIAYGRGGALETVKDGVFFYEQSPEAIREAVRQFESKQFDPSSLRQEALRFDKATFKTKIKQAIDNVIH